MGKERGEGRKKEEGGLRKRGGGKREGGEERGGGEGEGCREAPASPPEPNVQSASPRTAKGPRHGIRRQPHGLEEALAVNFPSMDRGELL